MINHDRNRNGVRVRMDGYGDDWANAHRDELPNQFFLMDVDGLMGSMVFNQNTTDQIFVEHVPDRFENASKTLRRFGTIAFFDRKASKQTCWSARNKLCLAFYLDICRRLSVGQPMDCKFFFVYPAPDGYEMQEVGITTGEAVGKPFHLKPGNWNDVWNRAGLTAMRARLKLWVESL